MNELNPEHIKYMPPSQEQETAECPVTETQVAAEEICELVEERLGSPTADVPLSTESPAMEAKPTAEETVLEVVAPRWYEFPLVKALYALLSPLAAPTVATLWIFLLSLIRVVVPEAWKPYTLTVFGATCVVPLLLLFVLSKAGVVSSMDSLRRRERLSLYIVELVAFGLLTWFFAYKGAAPWVWTVFCGAAAVTLANLVINRYIRISNHCSAMAGLLAVLIVINREGVPQEPLLWWVVGTAAAIGFVGTVAMTLGRHTITEVLAGYATGFLGIILMSLIH